MWLCKAVVIGEEKAERAHISPLSVSPELSHGIPTYFLWPRMNHMSPTWLQGNLGSVCSGRTGWTGLSDPVHLSLPQGRVILLRISFRSRRYHMFTQIFFVNILRALSCARSICIISFKPHCSHGWCDCFPQGTSFLFVSDFKPFNFVLRYSWLTVPLGWFHEDSEETQPYIYMDPFPQTHLPSRLPHHLECPRWLLKP